jgi:hypothetical protein
MVPIRARTAETGIIVEAKNMMLNTWKEMSFDCTPEQFTGGMRSYRAGAHVQDAFPFLNDEEREFLLSGITPAEWKATFGEDE